ncbi:MULTISPECIES: hypothetical protein [unclassified Pseudomonas]|uniref:hypothetical protein n=1 Tax=unclassified Pseudomonas TaxID=196821 RepID=UPI001A919282|nr:MULTISPECIES: hypothetical protein [unclassified Pseudomonas]
MKTFFGDRPRNVAKFLVAAAMWIALFAAVTLLVMQLWNWLMPALFVGVRSIDYGQALGLLLLSKILFGGGHGRWKARHRWDSMTVEEREQLKRHFKSRWGDRWRRSFDTESAEGAAPRTSHTASAEFRPRDTGSLGDKT